MLFWAFLAQCIPFCSRHHVHRMKRKVFCRSSTLQYPVKTCFTLHCMKISQKLRFSFKCLLFSTKRCVQSPCKEKMKETTWLTSGRQTNAKFEKGGRTRKLTTSDIRLAVSRWVADAWEEVTKEKEFMANTFQRTGLSLAIDGSQDDQINIPGVKKLVMQ